VDIVESFAHSVQVGLATCRLPITMQSPYRKFSGVRSWRANRSPNRAG